MLSRISGRVAAPVLRAARLLTTSANGGATHFPGAKSSLTTTMKFKNAFETFPTYRVMDEHGIVEDESQIPKFTKDEVIERYKAMCQIHEMDTVLYDIQRQGRISFYMTASGEEAIHIGTASAITLQDVIYAQYREVGVLLWRGFTLDNIMNQCFSTHLDSGKGRQMPVHYGSRKLNFQTISSPLGTQIPQASGAGYALRLSKTPAVCMCYFGDGAASEGDFHAALNFAATTRASTVFVCRNNGWAISTPTDEQYKGDGIAVRGPAYGIHTLRVDGNDVWAVYNATAAARELALKGEPVLLEMMTYRRGHHSTSDDATRYRPVAEQQWWLEHDNPIKRLRMFMRTRGWWSEEEETALRATQRASVLAALERVDQVPKPAISEVFTDVYDTKPAMLQEQEQQLTAHLAKHRASYPTNYVQ